MSSESAADGSPGFSATDLPATDLPAAGSGEARLGADSPRRVVFVVGSGRSGTSTMCGTLQALGVHVPQPEVQADATNPKGFGEPQWVVEFHDAALRQTNVQVSDARPSAWFAAGRLATNEPLRERLAEWLEAQFAEGGDELVIKDPRLAWFMGLWQAAALRVGAVPAYVTMLRPVTEVVGSKQRYYSARFGEVQRTAAWVNMMLHTERGTRDSRRAFVRYGDLLTDWTVPVFGIGQAFDLRGVQTASANDIRTVHQFIDPDLHRVQFTWDDVSVPPRLQEIAEETWRLLDSLADPDGDTPKTRSALDEVRTAYADLYGEAEALAQSSVLAAHREGAAEKAARRRPAPDPPAEAGASRRADLVPHRLRAMIPARARHAVRRALGRER